MLNVSNQKILHGESKTLFFGKVTHHARWTKWAVLVAISTLILNFSFVVSVKGGEIRDEPWVDIKHMIESTPTKSYMEEKRNGKTVDSETCKQYCDEWTADEILILKHDHETQKCTCFFYPWIDIFWYEDSPETKVTETYSVKRSLSRNVRPKEEPPAPRNSKRPVTKKLQIISALAKTGVPEFLFDGDENTAYTSDYYNGRKWVTLTLSHACGITKVKLLNFRGQPERLKGAVVSVCTDEFLEKCQLFATVKEAPAYAWITLTPESGAKKIDGRIIKIEGYKPRLHFFELEVYGFE